MMTMCYKFFIRACSVNDFLKLRATMTSDGRSSCQSCPRCAPGAIADDDKQSTPALAFIYCAAAGDNPICVQHLKSPHTLKSE
jgi:hypothetical protein